MEKIPQFFSGLIVGANLMKQCDQQFAPSDIVFCLMILILISQRCPGFYLMTSKMVMDCILDDKAHLG